MNEIKVGDKVKAHVPKMSYNNKIGTVEQINDGDYLVCFGKMSDGIDKYVTLFGHQLELVNEKCICEDNGWECGVTLYNLAYWDGGLDFEYIRNIKYCPVCGRELPKDEE